MRTRILSTVLAAATLLAACSGDGTDPTQIVADPSPSATADPEATRTPAPSPSPSPQASADDEWAVPDPVTTAYADRVVNEIERRRAEITRANITGELRDDPVPPPDQIEILQQLFSGPVYESVLDVQASIRASQEGRDQTLPAADYDQIRFAAEEILAATPCLVARARPDYTGSASDPTLEPELRFLFLRPQTASELNPTGWSFVGLVGGTDRPLTDEEARDVTLEQLSAVAPEVCR